MENIVGEYLNPPEDKLQWLLRNATVVAEDQQQFVDPATDKVAVCLVDNGAFMAAAVAYSEHEFNDFNREADTRPKLWFVVDLDKMAEIEPRIVTKLRAQTKSASPAPTEPLQSSDESSINLGL
jgi:hypothetical protein